jgi:hypothetical protein
VARADERQLVVVYCRSEALAAAGPAVEQLLQGLDRAPVPIDDDALVVSDNADIYGTVAGPAGKASRAGTTRRRRHEQFRLTREERRF